VSVLSEVGIVIKSFLPYKQKISVVSRYSGRLNLKVSRPRTFSPGAIISFSSDWQKKFSRGPKIELLMVPIDAMKDHLDWFHSLFEICYYFLPLDATCIEVFRLLQCSFELSDSHGCEQCFGVIKKLSIVRLLVYLGFYPPNRLAFMIDMFDELALSVRFLDSPKMQKVSSLHLAEVDQWIERCLCQHPLAKKFNTLTREKI
jgi:hypothetical protein